MFYRSSSEGFVDGLDIGCPHGTVWHGFPSGEWPACECRQGYAGQSAAKELANFAVIFV
jgi:hypothetical protein